MIKKLKNFLFNNEGSGQTIVKNAFWLSAGEIGSRLVKAILIIYAARILGASGYGVFSYVVGLAGFFTILSDLGLSQILTRQVSQKPAGKEEYFATGLVAKSALLLVTGLVIVFIAPYFSKIEEARSLLPLAALLVVFDSLRKYLSAFFRGEERMENEAALTITTNLSITAGGLFVLSRWASPEALTWVYALLAGTGVFLGIYLLREELGRVFKKVKVSLIKPMFSSAWPIAIMAMFGSLMLNIDLVMLGSMKGSQDVGFYSAGQKIVQLLYLLPTILAASFFPLISKLAEKGKDKIVRVMEESMTSVFLIGIPLSIGGVVLGRDIIRFVFGPEYIPAVLAFQVLGLTCLFVFPGKVLSNYLLAFNAHKKLIPFVGLAGLANVGLNLALIPSFGIVGSSFATIGSSLIFNGGAWWLSKKQKNFSTIRHLPKIVIGALFMGGFALILQTVGVHILVNIILSIVFYFGVLYLMGEGSLKHLVRIISNA